MPELNTAARETQYRAGGPSVSDETDLRDDPPPEDFLEPFDWHWSEEGYIVREALKKWSEEGSNPCP